MTSNLRFAVFFGTLALLFSACGNSVFYDKNVEIAEGAWPKEEPAHFEFKVEDTLQTYNFFINLRNGAAYPYSNLYLFVKTNFPNGRTKVDTLECQLASPSGEWYGSGLGDMYSNNFSYLSESRFPLKGEYKVDIHHAMRFDTLPDIYDIGFRLESANQ